MRRVFWLLSGLLLSSCAPLKSVDLFPASFDAFQKQIGQAPVFFTTVATDYEKTSRELQLLTGKGCNDLSTKAIALYRGLDLRVKTKTGLKRVTYPEYEADRLNIQSGAMKFLTQYADEMKKRAAAADAFAKGFADASTGTMLVDSIPVVGVQASPYTALARAIFTVLVITRNEAIAGDISNAARLNQKNLEKYVEKMRTDYGIIDRDSSLLLDAWADCRLAKVKAIAVPGRPGLGQTSAYELDASYSEFLLQQAEYKKAVPTVDAELKAIVEANRKIATGGDTSAKLSGANDLVGAANAAYKAMKAVPGISI